MSLVSHNNLIHILWWQQIEIVNLIGERLLGPIGNVMTNRETLDHVYFFPKREFFMFFFCHVIWIFVEMKSTKVFPLIFKVAMSILVFLCIRVVRYLCSRCKQFKFFSGVFWGAWNFKTLWNLDIFSDPLHI
jgi:hypothetical protein